MLNRRVVLGTNLEKCVLVGDPHVQMFHPVDQWPLSYKDCLDEGPLTAVRTSIVTILIDVHNWWMVDVCVHAMLKILTDNTTFSSSHSPFDIQQLSAPFAPSVLIISSLTSVRIAPLVVRTIFRICRQQLI